MNDYDTCWRPRVCLQNSEHRAPRSHWQSMALERKPIWQQKTLIYKGETREVKLLLVNNTRTKRNQSPGSQAWASPSMGRCLSHSDVCTNIAFSLVIEEKDKERNIYYIPNTDTPPIITLFHEVEGIDYKMHPNFSDVQIWKRKSQKHNNFQKIQNENYVLISEMLTCEEKKPQENLHHLIFRGSLINTVSITSASHKQNGNQTQESMMDALAPGRNVHIIPDL